MPKFINLFVLGILGLLLVYACTSVTEQKLPHNNTMTQAPPLVATVPTTRIPLTQRNTSRIAKPQPKAIRAPQPMLHDSSGYLAQGTASWYKRSEHGSKTSNGQIYDLYGMTAAHASLPISTRVRVENLRTGRSVIVIVNDRLNDNGNALIKLSYWAARRLKLTKRPSQEIEVVGMK